MNVKAIARPGVNPCEPVIFEQQARLKEVAGKTMLSEEGPRVPGHQQTERDPKKHDRGDVYGLESARSRYRENFLHAFKHKTNT